MTRTFTSAGNIVEPSKEDWERATAFVDGPFSEGRDPDWLARHREDSIRRTAIAEMQKRQDREFREAVARSARADQRCLAALEELPKLRDGLNSLGRAA